MAVVAIALGVFDGWAISGRLAFAHSSKLRYPLLVIILFVLQGIARGRLLGLHEASSASIPIWIACSVSLLGLLSIQDESIGLSLSATGMGLNALTVLGNGYMPVETRSVVKAASTFYSSSNSGTVLRFAGDCLPLNIGQFDLLLSVGDVLLMVGVAVFISHAIVAGSPRSIESSCDT